MTAVATAGGVLTRVVSRNGTGRHLDKVTKRDGSEVPFDIRKIAEAVRRCFLHCNADEETAKRIGEMIAVAVANILKHKGEPVGVEDVQRLVIQQLWAGEYHVAAEHYTIYREQRRVERAVTHISPEHAEKIQADVRHFPTDIQYYQYLSKFAKWREADRRRETWRETCDRVMNWFKGLPSASLIEDEWQMLDNSLHGLEATCAMRVIQMAGPALDRCHSGAFNCAYAPITDLRSFAELLYVLMQGTGMGFSVEAEYIEKLPRIRKRKAKPTVTKHKIDDSTEGWCNALLTGLEAWTTGDDIEYDYSGIRPAGTRLKTKGGRASGPGPLKELLDFARNLFLSRQGGHLSDIDVHDLCCVIGKIVQVGGVRRASCISLSDLDSVEMRNAKSGNWWQSAKWRSMANNSATYDEKPDAIEFMTEWLSLGQSGSGERGIFNRQAVAKCCPPRRRKVRFGTNPCAEIVLRPNQFCNLSIVVARLNDTIETLRKKVIAATYFGMLQSLCTNYRYLRDDWKKNQEEERLIGVDITGHADCPLLRYGAPGRAELLRELKQLVLDTAEKLADRFGIPVPAADTCVKPGGDSGVFFDCASGVSPRFAEHQWRWVRESVHGPMAEFLKTEGVPCETAPEDPSLMVFGFLKKAPPGATLVKDLTAIQQLENWLEWKREWAEHSVSCTIYIDPHEWFEAGNWVYDHFDEISGLSFMPRDNGKYVYAPNEQISKEQYDEALAKFPTLSWEKFARFERDDRTESSRTIACHGGKCDD